MHKGRDTIYVNLPITQKELNWIRMGIEDLLGTYQAWHNEKVSFDEPCEDVESEIAELQELLKKIAEKEVN